MCTLLVTQLLRGWIDRDREQRRLVRMFPENHSYEADINLFEVKEAEGQEYFVMYRVVMVLGTPWWREQCPWIYIN